MRVAGLAMLIVLAGCAERARQPTFEERLEDRRVGLARILEWAYEFDASKVASVDCPANPDTAPGNVFTCHVALRDAAGVYAVAITMGENASYRVGRPRLLV